MKVLLMTATPRGPAFSTLKDALSRMGVEPGRVTVKPPVDRQSFLRTPLWDVVKKPWNWKRLNHHSKVIEAVVLMTDYLWDNYEQSASILIFVAGYSEMIRMKNALKYSDKLKNVQWHSEILTLYGGSPLHEQCEAMDRMKAQEKSWKSRRRSDKQAPVLLTILTAGSGEDGWTPIANGMINCSEQIELDNLGFLRKGPSDKVSNEQRAGRVGRVTDSLELHLADPIDPSDTLSIPYGESLQVVMVAMELGYKGEIPGLSAVQQGNVVKDLVRGDIVFKIGVVLDPSGLRSLFLLFVNTLDAAYQPSCSFDPHLSLKLPF